MHDRHEWEKQEKEIRRRILINNRKISRRQFLQASTVCAAAGLLAACGSSSAAGSTAASTAASTAGSTAASGSAASITLFNSKMEIQDQFTALTDTDRKSVV